MAKKKHPLRFLLKLIRPLLKFFGYELIKADIEPPRIEEKLIELFGYMIVRPENNMFQRTYAQVAEDVIVSELFFCKGINMPKYLEIGVEAPIYINNTYKFYRRGVSGVLVEADPKHIDEIKKARPKDKLIFAAVGVNDKEAIDLYYLDRGCETTSKEEAEFRESKGHKIIKVVKVPCITINKVIQENFTEKGYPDFLSIDIEGMDLEVLKTLDFDKYPIPVICAETLVFGGFYSLERDYSISDFLLQKGYFVYADTYINTIFVNKDWYCGKKHSVKEIGEANESPIYQ